MQIRTLIVGIALGAVAALVSSQALSQQDQAGDTDPDAAAQQLQQQQEMQAAMEAWMQLIEPGPAHERLEPLLGEWNTTTEMYLYGPDEDPAVTEGTCTRRMVLGGRFFLQEENSTMEIPGPEGEPIERPWNGLGLFGYDNFRNMYVGCWADNMGTQLLTMTGSAHPAGNVFTYYGTIDEPMMGVIGKTVKYVTTIVDENTNTFEIYDLHAADDYMVVKVTYTRRDAEE